VDDGHVIPVIDEELENGTRDGPVGGEDSTTSAGLTCDR
ncbi:unnamed protein product, partial [Rotaria sp. Silwood2]